MLSAVRRANLNGVYDIHTNQMHYPRIMQPTHARIEQVVDSEEAAANPSSSSSTIFPPVKPSISRNFLVMDTHLEMPTVGISPSAYDAPFAVGGGGGGEDDAERERDREVSEAADFLAPFRGGLRAVPDDVRDLLPEDCRRAFDKARAAEEAWFARWGDESRVTSRKQPVIDKAIVPYSMTLS